MQLVSCTHCWGCALSCRSECCVQHMRAVDTRNVVLLMYQLLQHASGSISRRPCYTSILQQRQEPFCCQYCLLPYFMHSKRPT
jgi:hypothetical protein